MHRSLDQFASSENGSWCPDWLMFFRQNIAKSGLEEWSVHIYKCGTCVLCKTTYHQAKAPKRGRAYSHLSPRSMSKHTHAHRVKAATLARRVRTSNKATRTKPSESSEDFVFFFVYTRTRSWQRKTGVGQETRVSLRGRYREHNHAGVSPCDVLIRGWWLVLCDGGGGGGGGPVWFGGPSASIGAC